MFKAAKNILILSATLTAVSAHAQVDSFEEALRAEEQSTKPSLNLRVGAKASLIMASAVGSVLNYGGHVETAMSDNLSLGGRIDYWSIGSVGGKFSDLSFGGYGKYAIDLGGTKLRPYLSAGLASHTLTVSTGFGSGSVSAFGFDLGAGASYALDNGWSIDGGLDIRQVSQMSYTQVGAGVSKAI